MSRFSSADAAERVSAGSASSASFIHLIYTNIPLWFFFCANFRIMKIVRIIFVVFFFPTVFCMKRIKHCTIIVKVCDQ